MVVDADTITRFELCDRGSRRGDSSSDLMAESKGQRTYLGEPGPVVNVRSADSRGDNVDDNIFAGGFRACELEQLKRCFWSRFTCGLLP